MKRSRTLAGLLAGLALALPSAASAEEPALLSYSKSASMASNTTNVVNGQPRPGTLLLLDDQKLAVRSVPLGEIRAGETIKALSEVEVTNDVVTKDEQGTNVYHDVAAELTLIIADSPTATEGIEVAEVQGNYVTPQMHHWTFEKSGSFTAAEDLEDRYLNLVMWAHNPEELTDCWTFPRSSLPNPQQPRACGMDVDYDRGHLSALRTGPAGTAPDDATPYSLEQYSGQSVPETQPEDVPTTYSGEPAQFVVAMARPVGDLSAGDVLTAHSELQVDARDVVRSDTFCHIGVATRLYLSPSPTSLSGAVAIGNEAGYNFTGREQRQIKTLERGVVPSSTTHRVTQDLEDPQYVLLRVWAIGNSACALHGNGIRAKLSQSESYMHVARYRPEPQGNLVPKTHNSGDDSELAIQLDLGTAAPVSVYSQEVRNLAPGDRIEALSEVQVETEHDRAAVHSALVLADGPTDVTGTPLQSDNYTELNPYMASLPIHDAAGWTVPEGVSGDRYVNLVMRGEFLQTTAAARDNAIAIAPDGGRLLVQHIRPPDVTPPLTSIACDGVPCASAYNQAVIATLSATDTGGAGVKEVRYTTDGSAPTESSPIYSGPIAVNSTTTIRFRAEDEAGNLEAPNSQTIVIVPLGSGGGPSQPSYETTFGPLRSMPNGTVKLTVNVGAPGQLKAFDAKGAGAAAASGGATMVAKKRRPMIRPVSVPALQAGRVILTLVPSKPARSILKTKGRLTVQVGVIFTPAGGSPVSETLKGKLKLKRRRY